MKQNNLLFQKGFNIQVNWSNHNLIETSATDFEGINEIFTNISNELSKC